MAIWDWFRKKAPRADHAAWLTARIDEVATVQVTDPSITRHTQSLLDAYGALTGRDGKDVFGMARSALRVDDAQREAIVSALREAIVAVRSRLDAANDAVALYELAQHAEVLDLPELRLTRRAPLRSDPLGSLEGLSPEWQALIARLVRARDGELALRWSNIGIDVESDGEGEITFGAPAPDALYAFALRYEAELGAPFPRELAAFFAVANGISIAGHHWVLLPVREWSFEDEGLRIGTGPDAQGPILLSPDAGVDLAFGNVLVCNDDGDAAATFSGFADFVDHLLPP